MYVVGVDGGSTKTIALVADDQGHILSAARNRGSNWVGEDIEFPMSIVVKTVQQALVGAHLTGDDIALGVFTLAGADWPEDHTLREEFLSKADITQRVKVKNDTFGGLRAGLTRPYGMVLAAGSGMNAAVITPAGQEWAFGYYETFGGAVSMVEDAYKAVLRAEDGRGQPTMLTNRILEHLGFPTVEAMLRASLLRKIDRIRYLSFAPHVFEAALAGDPVSVAIIVRHGKGLAEYATAMARRFNMTDLDFDVVLAGSIFKGVGPLLIDTVTQEIHQIAPLAKIVRPRFEPVVGSVLLAYDALGIQVSESIYEQLEASINHAAPGMDLFNTAGSPNPGSFREKEE